MAEEVVKDLVTVSDNESACVFAQYSHIAETTKS